MVATADTAPYRAAFDAQPRAGEPSWLAERRATAMGRFEELGFPTRRDEAWRFTNLRRLQQATYPSSQVAKSSADVESAIKPYLFAGTTYRLVFVNGRFAPEHSRCDGLPRHVRLENTATVLDRDPTLVQSLIDETDTSGGQAFSALNAAFFADGYVLTTYDDLDRPIEIIHWNDAPESATHFRNLIWIGGRATIIETFIGGGRYWTNDVTLISLDDEAVLRHVKVQDESTDAIHLGQVRTTLGHAARYESFALTLGANLSRHDSIVNYHSTDSACGLFGAYLLRGEQEATNATFVDHICPSCTTDEVFKGVVDERAHGVFLGKIAVRPQAQKTNANQLNKNLLLSARANVDTKPELEILADDVKCSHGATAGDLDEQALFYLQARGIPAAEARRMLIEAFAADVIDRIEDNTALRAHLLTHVRRWLGRED